MRVANVLVFDENIEVDNGSGSSALQQLFQTDQALNEKLGGFDKLAIMAVVDNVQLTGSGSSHAYFAVRLQHSADGRNWLPRGTHAEIGEDSTPSYNLALTTSSGTTAQTPYYGSGNGGLAFVRLQTELQAPAGWTAFAHVRLYVTGRNWGNR